MNEKIELYTNRSSFIFQSIKYKKKIKDAIIIDFLQEQLHDIVYSYINGGFSKSGFLFYPLVKDLSKENIKKIGGLRIIAEILNETGYDFKSTLGLFAKKKITGKTIALFISCLYNDFLNIKKSGTWSERAICKKLNLSYYRKEDLAYLKPVAELRKYAFTNLKKFLSGFYIHGSIATRDYVRGWSDLDTLIIIKKNTLQKPEMLTKLRDILYKSKKFFYKIDPLQHHGHMVLTEYDFDYYCQTFFPLELFKYAKSVFGDDELNFKIRHNKAENINRFYLFLEYFRSLHSNRKFSMGCYELKFFLHAITLFPTMYLQAKGIHVYKKFSFNLAKKDFRKSTWLPVDTVSNIREKWKIPNKMPLIDFYTVNPLFAYQINSKYWDIFYKIKHSNNVNIKKLVNGMHMLSETAWPKIKF